MPDEISALILVSGLVTFSMSLVYLRAYFRFKKDMRENLELQMRAAKAAYLPPDQSRAEFAEVSRLMWARLGQSSPLYEQYQRELGASPNGKEQEDIARLKTELAELEKTSDLSNPQTQEELARLHDKLAISLRRARSQ